MAYRLGLDLGTTFSAVAAAGDGPAQIVTVGHHETTVPSVLFLKDDGTFVFGEAAARRGLSEPARVAREVKRRFGDTTPILLGGAPFSADALTAQLMRHLLAGATEQRGEAPAAVAVTHPANWGPYKIDLLRQTLAMADVPDAVLVTEPEAAAIFYASNERVDPGEIVAIYDLGGGTFDAAVLEKRADGGFTILGSPEGIERLGGIDFDEAIVSHVSHFAGPALSALDPGDPASLSAMARLRAECVAAKETLSVDTEAQVPVLLPTLQTEVRITRSEFEAMIRPTLAETVNALRRTLRAAKVADGDVKAILLVGGSSRIPLVGQLVSAEIGRPVALDVHPKHAVALGAALAADGARPSAAAAPPRGSVATVPVPDPPPVDTAPPSVAPPAAVSRPLAAPEPPASPSSEPVVVAPPSVAGARSRRALFLVGGAALLIVAAVVVVVVLVSGSGGGKSATPKLPPPAVPTFPIGQSVYGMVEGAGSLWMGIHGGPTIYRFDPTTHVITNSITLASTGDDTRVEFGAGSIWGLDLQAEVLDRIDPATNSVITRIPVGHGPMSILFAAGSVWVSASQDGVIDRVDPATDAVTRIVTRGQPNELAFDGTTVYVTDSGTGNVVKVDAAQGVVTGQTQTGGCPDYLVADTSAIWVQDECKTSTIFKVDPHSGAVVGTVTVGRDAKGLSLGGGSLWVANARDGTVSQVDPQSLKVLKTVQVGAGVQNVIADATGLWAANGDDQTLSRIPF